MQKLRKYLIISLIIVSLNFILFHDRKEYLSENNILGVYVDNELKESIPKKGEVIFSKAICDNDNVNYYWDVDNWGLFVDNLNKKTKCNLYFVNYSGQTVFDFDYTGAEQTFTVPVSGTYKLETWGAQGGDATSVYIGGAGGYTVGNINQKKSNKIYINIGGSGNNNAYLGGYNGGGSIRNDDGQCNFGSPGGGATHMSFKSGTLDNLENYKESILLVAGGGGAGDHRGYNYGNGYGGAGGGYIGNTGISVEHTNGYGYGYGTGGTQNSGGEEIWISDSQTHDSTWSFNGTFGQGATKNTLSDYGPQTGCGGGFYGGGSAAHGGGGGGSGYIGNPLLTNKVMYCYNCEESSEKNTKTISTTCNEETPTSYCAKKGNGYARITLISIDN